MVANYTELSPESHNKAYAKFKSYVKRAQNLLFEVVLGVYLNVELYSF